MTTSLQRAQNAIVMKAVLVRGLKALAPLYAGIVEATGEMEDGAEDANQGVLVPVWHFLEALDGIVDVLEDKSGREFPDAEIEKPQESIDLPAAANRASKALREISDWSEKLQLSLRKYEIDLADRFERLRDEAMQVAMGLEDLLLPESCDSTRDDLLMLEYKKLSGIIHN
jgi:hypothetical protein